MTIQAYQAALRTIAAIEADGEDATGAIASLARRTGMNPANVRQEVTELVDLLS